MPTLNDLTHIHEIIEKQSYSESQVMLIAEKKALRERIKLGFGALPMLQITGLIQLVEKVDFPFHLRADVSLLVIF